MKPLSLALSIEWDDCTVALAGAGIDHGTESTAIELSARTQLAASGGPQASRDALALVQQALRQVSRRLDEVERFYVNVGPGAFTSLRIAVGLVQGLALPGNRPVGAIGSLQALAATVPDWRFPLASPDVNDGLASGRLSSPASAPAADGFPGQDSHSGAEALPWLLCSALDARMGECYYAAFLCRAGHWPQIALPPAVGKADDAAMAFEGLRRQLTAEGRISTVHLAGGGFDPGFEPLRAWAMEVGQDAALAAGRRPGARALLAVADVPDAPALIAARGVRPLYVRNRVALDRDEQRQLAAARQAAQPAGR